MTVDEALARISVAVDRDDLEASYLNFLNRAIREVADRHSFDCMKVSTAATPLALDEDEETITLPSSFKELQNGRYPALYREAGETAWDQIPVFTRSELERLVAGFRPDPHLVYTQDDSGHQLTLSSPATADLEFLLYYFAFPATVAAGGNTPLLTLFPNMVLSKALSLIFQSINDPVYELHERQFDKEVAGFSGQDIAVSNAAPRPDKE